MEVISKKPLCISTQDYGLLKIWAKTDIFANVFAFITIFLQAVILPRENYRCVILGTSLDWYTGNSTRMLNSEP